MSIPLTIATYNIDGYSDLNILNRLCDVDVVCLQGIHSTTVERISRLFKSSGYPYFFRLCTSGPAKKTEEIIFSKLPVVDKQYYSYANTNQSRGLSIYTLDIYGSRLIILTSSLEGDAPNQSSGTLRRQQFKEINGFTTDIKEPIIFAGDTSIPVWQDGFVPSLYTDVWLYHGSDDTRETRSTGDRPDRILYRTSNDSVVRIECSGIELIVLDPGTNKKALKASFDIHLPVIVRD